MKDRLPAVMEESLLLICLPIYQGFSFFFFFKYEPPKAEGPQNICFSLHPQFFSPDQLARQLNENQCIICSQPVWPPFLTLPHRDGQMT